MNKRLTERERLLYKLNRLSEPEIAEVLDYVNLIEAAKETPANAQNALFPEAADDEIISTLSGAYENRRARQVAEWESIRRRADSLASVRHYAKP
jgi:hypothetical protein